ncbi:tetratricopeptide repeat protein [Tropicibacter sp. S64]|uniref:tetratricopeptide repeat protein n=1 Tax=Tropicibacter sp. S64 TaxID=3415122 RepID=UPI003C797B8C
MRAVFLCLWLGLPGAVAAQGEIDLPMSPALEQARDNWLAGRYDGIWPVIEAEAAAGSPVAQNLLGVGLTEQDGGQGIAYDPERGFAMLQAASDAGFLRATYNLAMVYGEAHPGFGPDYGKKKALAEAAVRAGYDAGQTLLGDLYHGGQGVDQSYETALHHYRLAADAGVPGGLRAVGYAYYRGEGVHEDVGLARLYLDRAVAAGDKGAIRDLAWLYEGNDGVQRDLVKAYLLYREGVRRGDARSAYDLGGFVAWAGYEGYWHDRVQGYGYCLLAIDWGHTVDDGEIAANCEEMAEGFTDAERATARAFADGLKAGD